MSVVVEKRQGFGVIRIDHVANLNALSPRVMTDLEAALADFASDTDIRVILITGTGRAFSAGADIRYLASASPDACRQYLGHAQNVLERIASLSVPLIAIVNGVCTGGGCTLAGACDLAIAADSTTFGEPEARIGLPGGFGNVARLVRRVGIAVAAELLLTGRIIDASAAERIGLVARVVPAAALWDEAEKLAAEIASSSPTAVAQIKRLLRGSNASGAAEIDAFMTCLIDGEGREGMQAFLEKAPPQMVAPRNVIEALSNQKTPSSTPFHGLAWVTPNSSGAQRHRCWNGVVLERRMLERDA